MLDTGTTLRPLAVQVTSVRRCSVLLAQCWGERRNSQPPTWPDIVGGVTEGEPRVLCVGPSEWLVTSDSMDPAELCRTVRAQVALSSLVDVTQGMAVFRVRGSAARALLGSLCGLDLHPDAFSRGHCGRTRIAHLRVIVDLVEEPARFELYAARSYEAYLSDVLTDAAVGICAP